MLAKVLTTNDELIIMENTDDAAKTILTHTPRSKNEKVDQWPTALPSDFEQRCTDCKFEPMHFSFTP